MATYDRLCDLLAGENVECEPGEIPDSLDRRPRCLDCPHTGLLLVGLVVLIAIGERGPPNILEQPLPVLIEFAGMPLMLVGFLAGWRCEAVGGVMAIAGFGLFLGTEMVVNGKPPGGVIPLFAMPGVLAAGQRRASEPVRAMELRASVTSWTIRGVIITD